MPSYANEVIFTSYGNTRGLVEVICDYCGKTTMKPKKNANRGVRCYCNHTCQSKDMKERANALRNAFSS